MNDACAIEIGDDGSLSLAGMLTFESVPGLYRKTEKLFQGGKPVPLIDLAKITAADSAGMSLLLEWESIERKSARNLQIKNAPPGLMSLARLCEADELLNMSGRETGP